MGPLYIGDITSLLGKMSHDHPTQLYSVVSISHNSSCPLCWRDTLESHATLTVPVIVTLVSPVTCFVLVFRFFTCVFLLIFISREFTWSLIWIVRKYLAKLQLFPHFNCYICISCNLSCLLIWIVMFVSRATLVVFLFG